MSLIFPKKEILYAPMLGTLGGGSARGFGLGVGGVAQPAEFLFETTGLHSFTVPSGVETACFLFIGSGGTGAYNNNYGGGNGGDLYWINDVQMNAGESWTIRVANGTPSRTSGSAQAAGSSATIGSFTIGAASGKSFGNNPSSYQNNTPYTQVTGSRTVGSGAYNTGGRGGPTSSGGSIAAGGGGAAGYSGSGGDGGGNTGSYLNPTAGTGGGGGGGGGSNQGHMGAGGGGTGAYGQGGNGYAGSNPPGSPTGGGGGSGGSAGANSTSSNAGVGGYYGGGGGAPKNESSSSTYGQNGVVRILWGEGRAFPSTNVDLASSIGGRTLV